jgi:Uma2 family endonuclease
MHDILDLPEVRQRVSRLSVAEYHQLGEFNENGKRTELIRGIVIEKMSKSPLHATIMALLPQVLTPLIPEGFSLRVDNPLTFTHSEPEPDVAVVHGTIRDFVAAHPTTAELVIEVAVSSVALDRENASLYAEAGVKEYWIVLAERQEVEVYRQPQDGRYLQTRTYKLGETLDCSSVPQLQVELSGIFPG